MKIFRNNIIKSYAQLLNLSKGVDGIKLYLIWNETRNIVN